MPVAQITDSVPSAGEDTYTFLHNFDAQELYAFMRNGMGAEIGVFIGIFLSGIALTLGMSAILLLASGREARQHYVLCAYTVTILLLLIAFETQALINHNTATIFFFRPYDGADIMLSRIMLLTAVVNTILVDGLLVCIGLLGSLPHSLFLCFIYKAWRCFLVEKALGSSNWGTLFQAFPACLWGIIAGTGQKCRPGQRITHLPVVAATVAGTAQNTTVYVGFGTIGVASNITLNIYATIFITTRLLLHRRMVMACVKDKALTTQHVYIIGILLESAIVNLPVTIITAVWIATPLEQVALPIAAASQVS